MKLKLIDLKHPEDLVECSKKVIDCFNHSVYEDLEGIARNLPSHLEYKTPQAVVT